MEWSFPASLEEIISFQVEDYFLDVVVIFHAIDKAADLPRFAGSFSSLELAKIILRDKEFEHFFGILGSGSRSKDFPRDGERELRESLDSQDISFIFREFFIHDAKKGFQALYGVR